MAEALYARSLQDFYSLAALYAREGAEVTAGQSTFSGYSFDDGGFGDAAAASAYSDSHQQVMLGLNNLAEAMQSFSQAVKTAGQQLYDVDAAVASSYTPLPLSRQPR